MVRRDFKSDARFRALAAAHTLQRVRRGKMCDVQAGIGNVHRELNVTFHDRSFGSRGHAAQPETERTRAGVHGAVLGHARVFGMLHDREIQLATQNQRLAHNGVFEDGLAIIGNRDCSGGLQRAQIGEGSALARSRRGCDGKHVDDRAALGLTKPLDPLD